MAKALYFWQIRERNPNGGRWVKRYHALDQFDFEFECQRILRKHVLTNISVFPRRHPETGQLLKTIDGETAAF